MDTTEQTTETVVRATLAAHDSMYLATAGPAGPWVNGVFFVETDPFTLSFLLEQRGRTLAAIRHDPQVAIIVSTGVPTDPFLQAQAVAEVLTEGEADEARRLLVAKVPAAEPFLGVPTEAVRVAVGSWRVTDVLNGWLPGRELAR